MAEYYCTKKADARTILLHYNRRMEQPKTRGRPRKAEDEKLVRLVLYVPPAVAQKVDQHGKPWAVSVLRRAKPPAG